MTIDQNKVWSFQLKLDKFLEEYGQKVDDRWLMKFSTELIRETELFFDEVISAISINDINEKFVEQCRYDWSSFFSEDYFDYPDLLSHFIAKILPQSMVLLLKTLTESSISTQKVKNIQLSLNALVLKE